VFGGNGGEWKGMEGKGMEGKEWSRIEELVEVFRGSGGGTLSDLIF
jgi:hypothetical protein